MGHIAISWSRWSDFDQCPRKFYMKYIEKAPNFQEKPGEKSVHLIRGEQLHKQLENYVIHRNDVISGAADPMPAPAMSPETQSLTPLLDELIASSERVLPETQLAIDRDWKQVEWFDKKAAMRAILDLIAKRATHAIIWDYKSGKFKPYADECGQLHLSAAMIIMITGVSYCDVSYLFLDEKKPDGIRVTQEQVPGIVQRFNERFERVNSEVTWGPKRNEFCGWCQATKDQCVNSRKF